MKASPIDTTRLKYVANLNMGQSPSGEIGLLDEDPDILPFMQGNAEFGAKYPVPNFSCPSPPKKAMPEDLLISVRAPVGAINICNQEVGIGRGLCAISWQTISPQFGWWLMHEKSRDLEIEATGSTYKAVSVEDVGNLRLPTPLVGTQMVIAKFLDAKTERIDKLITAKESMLQLLEEKRSALISRAVTRGLDPKAPTKSSGFYWLGEIPKHWEIERAKNLFSVRDERSEDGEEELLTVSHITGVTSRAEKNVNMFMSDDMTGYKQCMKNDFVTNTLWAWMGAMGVSPLDGIVSPDYHVYTSKGQILPEFMELLCRSKPFVAEVIRWSKGVWSSRLRLYPENFFEIRLPVPPKNEQKEIVAGVTAYKEKAAKIADALVESIKLLKERRSALITAAVTGQIPLEEMSA